MVEVYYYIPANKAEDAVTCGMKLSEWYDREVVIEGNLKRCISTLLNPRDDYDKYTSPVYKCLKLEIMSKYCFAADKFLYNAGVTFPGIMEIYNRSIVPVEKYHFGRYRLPECLVTSTIISDFVSILDKRLDSPILYNNSEELYMSNIIEGYKETHYDFSDVMLYSFYSKLAEAGKVKCLEDVGSGIAIFIDERDDRTYTLKIPDLEKY